MAMGLSEAATATGVNRSTLFRAYKSGRMSATRAGFQHPVIEVEPVYVGDRSQGPAPIKAKAAEGLLPRGL
jgi:hypothetical protein